MSGNLGPAVPSKREAANLPAISYADAAEEALEADTDYDNVIDEDAIKESPTISDHQRQTSRPRPLGEAMDEDERSNESASPSLRHPKGRLEEKEVRESYADTVKEHEAASENEIVQGNGVPPAALSAMANGTPTQQRKSTNGHKTPEAYEGQGEDETARSPTRKTHTRGSSRQQAKSTTMKQAERAEPAQQADTPAQDKAKEQKAPSITGADGNADAQSAEPSRQQARSTTTKQAERAKQAQQVDTPAQDQAKEPKATSTTGADGNADALGAEPSSRQQAKSTTTKQAKRAKPAQQADTPNQDKPKEQKAPSITGVDGNAEAESAEPGQLIYENLTNKSGENLATIKPFDDYRLSLQQRENKPSYQEPPRQAFKARGRSDSELVSGRRAGAGWSQSAIRWAPSNIPLQRRLQTVMVLMHTLSIAGGLAIFFLLCGIPILWPILLPYLLYVLFSRASVNGKLTLRNEWLRRSKVWSLFASYYPARLHRSQTLEPTRKYIFGYHPHGIISHGAFAAFATEALGFSQLFPGITNTLLTLDSNFRVPLYRDYALSMGLASVSRESCENILSRGGRNGEGMGRAITIVVGGARESLDAKPYSLKLVLKRRKGFVKLAIRTGADLVPVLAFGENDLYDQFDASAHPYVHKAQLIMKKFMGFTVPLFHARGTL